MADQNNLLSIILLSYYSKDRIIGVFNNVKEVFEKENIPFEFIIMDDGSTDGSYDIALALEKKNPNVFAYQLSRNYTSNYSIFAGLSVSKGSCATIIPDDGQLPYGLIVEMFRFWQEGNKIVIPFRKDRNDGWLNDLFAKFFYSFINKFSIVKYPSGGSDAFLIDREIINLLNNKIHPINTVVVPEILRLGFSPLFVPYIRPKSQNSKSRWSFKKKVRLAEDTFFSSSAFPIKLISRIGLFFAIISFLLICLYIYIRLWGNPGFWGYSVPGWTSLVLFISFFSGIILLSLGIIAEYIWRIYEEVKGRPGFIIKEKPKDNNSE